MQQPNTPRAQPRRLAVGLALLAACSYAHAYVDPGSGMLIWQGLIALIGAVVIFVRHPIDTIKRWLKRRSDK